MKSTQQILNVYLSQMSAERQSSAYQARLAEHISDFATSAKVFKDYVLSSESYCLAASPAG